MVWLSGRTIGTQVNESGLRVFQRIPNILYFNVQNLLHWFINLNSFPCQKTLEIFRLWYKYSCLLSLLWNDSESFMSYHARTEVYLLFMYKACLCINIVNKVLCRQQCCHYGQFQITAHYVNLSSCQRSFRYFLHIMTIYQIINQNKNE